MYARGDAKLAKVLSGMQPDDIDHEPVPILEAAPANLGNDEKKVTYEALSQVFIQVCKEGKSAPVVQKRAESLFPSIEMCYELIFGRDPPARVDP